MLYRGVSKKLDVKNEGRILPRGSKVEVVPKLDGKWKLDGKFVLGASIKNTVHAHHIETSLYDGAGISTSASEEIARYFATHEYGEDGVCNRVEGYVYVIEQSLLKEAGVTVHKECDPKYPDEQEVTLIEKSGRPLPEFVIIDKYAIDCNGKRI